MVKKREKCTFAMQLQGLKEYVSDSKKREIKCDQYLSRVDSYLLNPDLNNIWRRVGVLSLDLERIARWISTEGAVKIACGNSEGWKNIQRAFQYHGWATRSRHALVDHEQKWDSNATCSGSFDVSTEVHLFLEAIATFQDEFAHGFGKHILKYFLRTRGGDRTLFYMEPLKPFAFKLYCTWIGEDITFRDDVANPLGGYQAVFDAWDSPNEMKGAITQACKIHDRECNDRVTNPMFVFEPYNIFPVEIMALYRVRSDLGLETPIIDHPLLTSPLFQPPRRPVSIHDPLLERVVAHILKDFPKAGLSHPWL